MNKWIMHCPICGEKLEKDDPREEWFCSKCGWKGKDRKNITKW